MANKIELNKVYKCSSAAIASASIHVAGGTAKIKGSNVTRIVVDRGAWAASIKYDECDIVSYKKTLLLVKKPCIGIEPDISVTENEYYKKIQDCEIVNGMLMPKFEELLDTDDDLEPGIHIVAGLPEWYAFEGTATEIWIKAGINTRVTPTGENDE